MATPFDRAARAIPVTVVTGRDTGPLPLATLAPDTALAAVAVARPAPLHDHAPGTECLACASLTDVRALLFDLLQQSRQGTRPPFTRVLLDLRGVSAPQHMIDRLVPGRQPATALRDHTVAKSFHVLNVVEV